MPQNAFEINLIRENLVCVELRRHYNATSSCYLAEKARLPFVRMRHVPLTLFVPEITVQPNTTKEVPFYTASFSIARAPVI